MPGIGRLESLPHGEKPPQRGGGLNKYEEGQQNLTVPAAQRNRLAVFSLSTFICGFYPQLRGIYPAQRNRLRFEGTKNTILRTPPDISALFS